MPYPNHQMPYPQESTQQMPYPHQANQQMPYPQHPNYPTQMQAVSFVPSTSNQPAINPQHPQPYYNPIQGVIVSTAPYNPTPSAPPVNRY